MMGEKGMIGGEGQPEEMKENKRNGNLTKVANKNARQSKKTI